MDVLSNLLELVDVKAALPCRLEANGAWAFDFAAFEHLRVGAVLTGTCWLVTEGVAPIRLNAGDCYLLSSGRPYRVASSLEVEPRDGTAAFARVWPNTLRYGDDRSGNATVAISAAISLDVATADLLLDHLPGSVRVPSESPGADVLSPVLELLGRETEKDSEGSGFIRMQLSRILFAQVLRTLLSAGATPGGPPTTGWLAALNDERISAALVLMHREADRSWTVGSLAHSVGMSRSAFAQRFRELVGVSPLDYLARWRIQAAARTLRTTDRTIGSIATDLGFSSDSVFSRTFKRMTGTTPSTFRAELPR